MPISICDDMKRGKNGIAPIPFNACVIDEVEVLGW
jgi:hypothetical protein